MTPDPAASAITEKPTVPLLDLTIESRVNPALGWNQWYADDLFFESAEEAVLSHMASDGLLMPYARWVEVYRWLERAGGRSQAKTQSHTSGKTLPDAPWAKLFRSFGDSQLLAIRQMARAHGWRGAPDLMVEKGGETTFVEVKSRGDSLTSSQRDWANGLISAGLSYLLVRVATDLQGAEITRDDFIHESVRRSVERYVTDQNGSFSVNSRTLFAFVRDSLFEAGKWDMAVALRLESRLHKLYGGARSHRLIAIADEVRKRQVS